VCERPEDVLTRTTYGHPFDSSFEVGNVCGVQFHPEKSHSFGMGFLRSYLGEREGA
jgi:glutamine amidotransferase